jgi:hypothetical protein
MTRLEAGPSGEGADNSARSRSFFSPTWDEECMRWPCHGRNARPKSMEVQAAVFPGVRQTSTVGGCWRSGPSGVVGKNCDPTRVAVEQTTQHRARNAEVSAESRSTTTTLQDREVLKHAGPMGSGVPRALHP